MKFNATVLSIAATLALAACGGGGGDSVTTNSHNTLPVRQIAPANADKATYQRTQDTTIYSITPNSNSVAGTANRLDRIMAEGVISATNAERSRNGKGRLVEDAALRPMHNAAPKKLHTISSTAAPATPHGIPA